MTLLLTLITNYWRSRASVTYRRQLVLRRDREPDGEAVPATLAHVAVVFARAYDEPDFRAPRALN
jgi:hypothetical protein